MDDRGQIILLAALAVSVCLIVVAMHLISIQEAEAVKMPRLGQETLENTIWAQDIGLKDVAGFTGSYPGDRRTDLADDYKNGTDRLIKDISRDVCVHGTAFTFKYNDTLATEYVAGSEDVTMANIGGIIIKKSNNTARVCGCAYDVSMTDGSAQYRLSRVVCWG